MEKEKLDGTTSQKEMCVQKKKNPVATVALHVRTACKKTMRDAMGRRLVIKCFAVHVHFDQRRISTQCVPEKRRGEQAHSDTLSFN